MKYESGYGCAICKTEIIPRTLQNLCQEVIVTIQHDEESGPPSPIEMSTPGKRLSASSPLLGFSRSSPVAQEQYAPLRSSIGYSYLQTLLHCLTDSLRNTTIYYRLTDHGPLYYCQRCGKKLDANYVYYGLDMDQKMEQELQRCNPELFHTPVAGKKIIARARDHHENASSDALLDDDSLAESPPGTPFRGRLVFDSPNSAASSPAAAPNRSPDRRVRDFLWDFVSSGTSPQRPAPFLSPVKQGTPHTSPSPASLRSPPRTRTNLSHAELRQRSPTRPTPKQVSDFTNQGTQVPLSPLSPEQRRSPGNVPSIAFVTPPTLQADSSFTACNLIDYNEELLLEDAVNGHLFIRYNEDGKKPQHAIHNLLLMLSQTYRDLQAEANRSGTDIRRQVGGDLKWQSLRGWLSTLGIKTYPRLLTIVAEVKASIQALERDLPLNNCPTLDRHSAAVWSMQHITPRGVELAMMDVDTAYTSYLVPTQRTRFIIVMLIVIFFILMIAKPEWFKSRVTEHSEAGHNSTTPSPHTPRPSPPQPGPPSPPQPSPPSPPLTINCNISSVCEHSTHWQTFTQIMEHNANLTHPVTTLGDLFSICGQSVQSSFVMIYQQCTGQSPEIWRMINTAGTECIEFAEYLRDNF